MAGSNYNEHPWRVVNRDRDRERSQEFAPTPAIPDSVLRQLTMLETNSRLASAAGLPEEAAHARQQAEDIYRITERHVRQRLEEHLFRESPFFGRGFNPYSGGAEMRSPLQWSQPPGDPMEFPDPALPGAGAWTNSERVFEREFDLRRRLDEVRDILGLDDINRRISHVEVFDRSANSGPFSTVRVFIGTDRIDRLNLLLSHEEVPRLIWEPDDDVNTWGDVTNRRGERGRIQLTGKDGREFGTILDAAARPVRKFRLVEQ